MVVTAGAAVGIDLTKNAMAVAAEAGAAIGHTGGMTSQGTPRAELMTTARTAAAEAGVVARMAAQLAAAVVAAVLREQRPQKGNLTERSEQGENMAVTVEAAAETDRTMETKDRGNGLAKRAGQRMGVAVAAVVAVAITVAVAVTAMRELKRKYR